MGGSISAKLVPCAMCCEKPRKNTKAGTMMMPPPTPTNPLRTPAEIPIRRRIMIVVVVIFCCMVSSIQTPMVECSTYDYALTRCFFELTGFFSFTDTTSVIDLAMCHISTGGTAFPIARYWRCSETLSNLKVSGKD